MAVLEVSYDVELLAVMSRALDEACDELEAMTTAGPAVDPDAARNIMAMRIVAAAEEGVREPKQLKILALHAIGGCTLFPSRPDISGESR
jgi:hypothetical protein